MLRSARHKGGQGSEVSFHWNRSVVRTVGFRIRERGRERAEPELREREIRGRRCSGGAMRRGVEVLFIRPLLYARQRARHFIGTNTLNLHKYLEGWVFIFPLYKGRS